MKEYDKRLSIKNWEDEDRPREKLLLKGKQTLSNAELIAILLGSGNNEETAVDLSQRILKSVDNNIINLSRLSVNDLCKFKGIGEAKAISIIAAMELGRRRRGAEVSDRKKISSSKDVFEIFQPNMADSPFEEFWILLLNRANKIIGKYQISQGGVSGTVADPKRIFHIALSNLASGIILCHNHPSGNIKPSAQDVKLTKKIADGAKFMEISLLDHIILGDEQYYSFADSNML
jgi:DNA repair protein RadC